MILLGLQIHSLLKSLKFPGVSWLRISSCKSHSCCFVANALTCHPRTIPNSASSLVTSRKYATSPHLDGSEGDLRTAKHFFNFLQHELCIRKSTEYPFYPAGSEASRNATLSITNLTKPTAWIDVYYPILNTPLDRSLAILGDDGTTVWSAKLEEIADELDNDAYTYAESVGAWHGLSRDGEAEGRLIYAHYGRKRDYDELVEKGQVAFATTDVPRSN